jgi:hypothetical protein
LVKLQIHALQPLKLFSPEQLLRSFLGQRQEESYAPVANGARTR